MHSPEFKTELVARCQQSDVSVTAIALDHDVHPSLLHRWVTEHARYGKHSLQDNTATTDQALDMPPANWIGVKSTQVDGRTASPVKTDTSKPAKIVDAQQQTPPRKTVELELAARGLTLRLHWPAGDHQGLARFARELLT